MRIRFTFILFVTILIGFPGFGYAVNLDKVPSVKPDYKFVDMSGPNRSPIDESMVNRDPAFILGSLLYLPEKRVTGINFAKDEAKFETKTKNDLRYKKFIENKLTTKFA